MNRRSLTHAALRVCSALLLARSSLAQTSSVPATSPLVAWSGRYAALPDGSGQVACDWASTAATLAVLGGPSGATLTFFTNATFAAGVAGRVNVFVNGFEAANVLVPAGALSFLAAAALPANVVSNVTFFYSMEQVLSGASASNYMVFSAFAAAGGSLVSPPQQSRRIDVVGDSITAGSSYDRMEAVNGVMSLGGHCAPWCPLYGYSQANNWQTYLARLFDANLTTIAWSGKGLVYNSGCKDGPTMADLFPKTFGTRADTWDFSRSSRPDAFLLFLGEIDQRQPFPPTCPPALPPSTLHLSALPLTCLTRNVQAQTTTAARRRPMRSLLQLCSTLWRTSRASTRPLLVCRRRRFSSRSALSVQQSL